MMFLSGAVDTGIPKICFAQQVGQRRFGAWLICDETLYSVLIRVTPEKNGQERSASALEVDRNLMVPSRPTVAEVHMLFSQICEGFMRLGRHVLGNVIVILWPAVVFNFQKPSGGRNRLLV